MPFFVDREVEIGKYKHASYKPCYWFEQSLRTGGRRHCYKHEFGIDSFGCIQSTSFKGCNLACVFCWRSVESRPKVFKGYDDPEVIVEELIKTQKSIVEESLEKCIENYNIALHALKLISIKKVITVKEVAESYGTSNNKVREAFLDLYNSGLVLRIDNNTYQANEKIVNKALSDEEAKEVLAKYFTTLEEIIETHKKAMNPKHVAISYDGEPTIYPRIGELIAAFRKRGISTFLVTNGTFPERIIQLWEEGNLPTQLYVTVQGPDYETYLKTTSSVYPYQPSSRFLWERLNKTLEILGKLPCRTVMRITAVKYVNMVNPEGYRKLALKANPDFLEIKGYAISGHAPMMLVRLGMIPPLIQIDRGELMKQALEFSPTYEEIEDFARQVSQNFTIFPKVSGNRESAQILMAVRWKDLNDISIKQI
jgi:wyosine [tRNA(Phe)-imidazoG37] synthetase (radical SAM superfamily)